MNRVLLLILTTSLTTVFAKTVVAGRADGKIALHTGIGGIMETIVTIPTKGPAKTIELVFTGSPLWDPTIPAGVLHNEAQTLFGFNIVQATKSNTAILVCSSKDGELLRVISDFDARVKALYPDDADVNDYDIRIKAIIGNQCIIEAIQYGHPGFSRTPLTVQVNADPCFRLDRVTK